MIDLRDLHLGPPRRPRLRCRPCFAPSAPPPSICANGASAATAIGCAATWGWLRLSDAPSPISALILGVAFQMLILAVLTMAMRDRIVELPQGWRKVGYELNFGYRPP
jgi:hypothetical protein